MTTLNEIHNALPILDWRTDKDLLTVGNHDEIEIVTATEFYERYLLNRL